MDETPIPQSPIHATGQTKFNPLVIEDEFDAYMLKVAPSVSSHTIQYRESRRAFVAGARRLYIYMIQSVTELSDENAEKELQRLDKEMCAYWKLACDDKD